MNVYKINIILLVYFVLCLGSYIFFSRGLMEDGVYILYQMIIKDSFFYFETPRIIAHFFQQLPAWLFIKFASSTSIDLLVKVFSFGLIWIHIISFLGCYFILPKKKKHYIFFPLFAFFNGPLTAFGDSISASLSVCSYIWLPAFVMYYSDLSLKRHKIFFLLTPLPLLLSHELMSYMAWPLIYLCVLKLHNQNEFLSKSLIKLLIAFFIMVSALNVFYILNINSGLVIFNHNFLQFKDHLFSLKFLYLKKQVNISILMSLILTLSFFIDILKRKKPLQIMCLMFLSFCFFSILLNPFSIYERFFFTDDYISRVWSPIFSLPFFLLLWHFIEAKKITINLSGLFLFSCFFAFTGLTMNQIKSDFKFYKHQKEFSQKFERCYGFVKWSSVKEHFNIISEITSVSVIYPKKRDIKSLIVNDTCVKDCTASLLEAGRDSCESVCSFLELNPSNILQNLSFPNRFFNYKDLMENQLKGLSVCQPPK